MGHGRTRPWAGAACARLLVRAAEEVTRVSPETAKLLALKESILRETPDARGLLSARADACIADMDVIVTVTAGAGKMMRDILQVKPVGVITDAARPLDLPPGVVYARLAETVVPALEGRFETYTLGRKFE